MKEPYIKVECQFIIEKIEVGSCHFIYPFIRSVSTHLHESSCEKSSAAHQLQTWLISYMQTKAWRTIDNLEFYACRPSITWLSHQMTWPVMPWWSILVEDICISFLGTIYNSKTDNSCIKFILHNIHILTTSMCL